MRLIRFRTAQRVPASHEDPQDPGALKRVLLTRQKDVKGTIQMINWATILPNKSFHAHYHEEMYEIFIMVGEGATVDIDGKETILHSGDALVVYPREVHMMNNPTSAPIDYVVIGIARDSKGKSVNV